ncbi:signal recognition particle-docking protein FtsY [Brevibacterium sp. 5221]|uniref:Signal recognition particle receptor FtsY n=1 Tax=Brevibacterium rongguiense TaxID=2695267 RepID=A0A6N9H8E8_9MICO|nr:signal recognition particle-docking protein FtsY [Brevibacterium rongguiense]MYM20076.1 signal recognition particle-docking protein FtsY [Brevibacterium rongguiense]
MDPLSLIVLGALAVIIAVILSLGLRGPSASAKAARQAEAERRAAEPVSTEPGSRGEGAGASGAGDDAEPAAPSATGEHLSERPAETPTAPATRLGRLRARLAKSNSALGRGLLALLSRDTLDEATWEEIEDTLIMADLGVDTAGELVEALRERVRVIGTRDPETVRELLREELIRVVDPSMDRELAVAGPDGEPAVVLVVGVNGSGKTTTVGKIARVLVAEDKDVVLGAADTFRAAASEQLTTWGERVGVETIRGPEGSDPASVAYAAVEAGKGSGADVVLIDTAGRLQNKRGLMDELGKVKRVATRPLSEGHRIDEVLLVLDATTGQNGMKQAQVFAEVVDITGIVLTKLDGTAKGGIVVAVQRELGVPVKLIGLGEGADDLAPFTAEGFVDALLEG